MHFFDKLHKKFKKDSRESDFTDRNLPLSTTTTFTMKKSFAALKMSSLAGAFGHCRTDEDKVKLLSVLSNTSFNGDDDDSVSSASGGDIVTSSTTSSMDERRHERTPPMDQDLRPSIEINDCCVVDDDVLSHSANLINNNDENVATNVDDDCDKRRETIKRDVRDYSSSADVKTQQQNEWTFTLYDFDAKGKVTKEDILSLVRSIYEVLAKAKIPIIRGCHDSTTGRPIGAFKVKLAVVNDGVGGDVKYCKTNDDSNKKSSPVKKIHKTKYISVAAEMSGDDDDDGVVDDTLFATTTTAANNNDHNNSFDVDRFYEEIPLLRRSANVKKALKRQHDNGKLSTSPIPYGKLHRHSTGELLEQHISADAGASSQPTAMLIGSPPRKQCTNCTYRDYVNLSEVENCCSHHHNGGHHHNHQSSSSTTCANKCIHHIRHCDRHCHCPPTTTSPSTKLITNNIFASSSPCNDPCLTSLENEYEKNLHRKLFPPSPLQQCCNKNKLSSLDTVINLHNQQNLHNHHGLPLNERARAYYSQQRKQSSTSKRNDISTLDYVDLKDLGKDFAPLVKDSTPLKSENYVKISSHQKKHRNREKDKIRAMQQVREWILNDVDALTTDLAFETNELTTKTLSNEVVDSDDAVKIKELRGEADGGNRYLVEHKHVHEHHHFHHF